MAPFTTNSLYALRQCGYEFIYSTQVHTQYWFRNNIQTGDIENIVAYFSKGYYCDKDGIKEALRNFNIFNIIDHASGFKADFVILKNEPFRQEEFRRKLEVDFDGELVYVVTPEDLLISKIIWIQQYQSPQQMQDIEQLAKVENLDHAYIKLWLTNLNLNTFGLYNILLWYHQTHQSM